MDHNGCTLEHVIGPDSHRIRPFCGSFAQDLPSPLTMGPRWDQTGSLAARVCLGAVPDWMMGDWGVEIGLGGYLISPSGLGFWTLLWPPSRQNVIKHVWKGLPGRSAWKVFVRDRTGGFSCKTV